jgi:hypothetical protein
LNRPQLAAFEVAAEATGPGLRPVLSPDDDPEVLPQEGPSAVPASIREFDPADGGVRIVDPALLLEVLEERDLRTAAARMAAAGYRGKQ